MSLRDMRSSSTCGSSAEVSIIERSHATHGNYRNVTQGLQRQCTRRLTPHSGYHFDGSGRRFFEGWYFKARPCDWSPSCVCLLCSTYRCLSLAAVCKQRNALQLTLPGQGQSFAFIYSVADPAGSNKFSSTAAQARLCPEHACSANRVTLCECDIDVAKACGCRLWGQMMGTCCNTTLIRPISGRTVRSWHWEHASSPSYGSEQRLSFRGK